jgi:DNA-binding NarL/FixJ family response regulator
MSGEGVDPARVLIVEGYRIFGEAISAAITDECMDVRVIAIASTAEEALRRLSSVHADVVLIGSLAEQTGTGVVERVLARHPSMPLLLYAGSSDSPREMVVAGRPIGVVPKNATVGELCDAIRAVVADPPPA